MVDLKPLREQNPWWGNKEAITEDEKVKEAFNKKHKLLYEFKDKENKLFIGPRQVGKTTFFKLLIYDLIKNKAIDTKKIFYFSCETLRSFEDLIDIVRKSDFLVEGEKFIFLDEVGFVEGWERAIKYVLDSPLSKNKTIYITGSSSLELKKESFPGRKIKIENFLPLTFKDFCKIFGSEELKKALKLSIEFNSSREIFERAKQLLPFKEEMDRLFYKFLQSGGFPKAFYELIEEGGIKEETYEMYWKWLVSDIAKLKRSEKIAIGVIAGILKNYGTKFSLSSIAKETEIGSHVTVREYLEILESLCVLRNFYTFDINKNRIIYRKTRKAYFIDPFLYSTFLRKVLGIKEIEDESKLVEGVVVEGLCRKIEQMGFYHNRKEIDIVFKNFGIEVKWKEKVESKDFPKVDIKNKLLLCKEDVGFDEEKNLAIIPVNLFLCML